MTKLLLLAFLMLIGGVNLYSQEETEDEILELEIDEDDIFEEENLSLNMKIVDFKQPFIKLSTGFSTPTYRDETGETIDNFKAIFGFKKYSERKYKDNVNIQELSYNGVMIHNFNYDSQIFNSDLATEYQIGFWNFGIAHGEGMGYKLGKSGDIILGRETGFGWLRMQYPYDINLNDENLPLTEFDYMQARFGDDVRFNSHFETFIKIRPVEYVSLDLGFQRNLIYPRFQFWYWTASGLIEGVASAVSDSFIKKITKSSPYAGPVVNFILKNAISYAFMELRKNNMNWPISGEEPLIINSFNFGLTFHF
jgi:hypothetical protein